MASDEDEAVRDRVPENPNTPVALLQQLARDQNDDVRWIVAENPNTPVQALQQLAKDYDIWVIAAGRNY